MSLRHKIAIVFILGFRSLALLAEWGEPISLGYGRNLDFAIDYRQHELHVLYVRSTEKTMVYSKVDTSGAIEINEEDVPSDERENTGWSYSPQIAVDQAGRPHIIYRSPIVDDDCDLFYNVRSNDNWGTPLKIGEDIKRGANVRMDIDRSGNVHVVHTHKNPYFVALGQNTPFVGVEYKRINSSGTIVYSQTVIDTLLEQRFDSPMELAIDDDDNVHLILGCPHLHEGLVTYYKKQSTQNGFTRQQMILHEGYLKRHAHPDVVTDDEGNVHICYGVQEDPDLELTSSVRYVRFENDVMVRNVPTTNIGELLPWSDGKTGWGLGTLTTTDDGLVVGIGYLTKDNSKLRVHISQDRGVSWAAPVDIVNRCGMAEVEGRDPHMLRSDGDRFFLLYPTSDGQIMMQINKDVRETPAAPLLNDVQISGGTNLKLSVTEDLAVAEYNIYRAESAEFEAGPGNLYATTAVDMRPEEDGFQWIDTGAALDDASQNYFYKVTGVSGSKESGCSAVVGEFEYGIVTTGTTDFNPIALAMTITGVNDAITLLDYLDDCNSVAKWNAIEQKYDQYVEAIPGSNFTIASGDVCYVNATENSVLTLTGSAVNPSYLLRANSNNTSFNDVMLPLDMPEIEHASDLASSIGGNCDAVVRFVVGSQTYDQYDVGDAESDFEVEIGGAYKVNVTANTQWPSQGAGKRHWPETSGKSASPYTQAPHTARGIIENGHEYSMQAFIMGRENEILNDHSPGCRLTDTDWVVQVGNFPSAWKAGDTLRVVFTDKSCGALADWIQIPLTYKASDRIQTVCCASSDAEAVSLPERFDVSQNYPNPFNGQTRIRLSVPVKEEVDVMIYDVLGKEVKLLHSGEMEAGYHQLTWDGKNNGGFPAGSGLYFYKVMTQSQCTTKKMVLIQ